MSLSQHKSKLEQSGKVNDETEAMMKSSEEGRDLLKLSRAEIQEKLGSLAGGEDKLAGSPVLEAVSTAVAAAESIQKERAEIVQDLEKELTSEDIVPELMEVVQKKRDQGTTMDTWKGNFSMKAQQQVGELASRYMTICLQLKEQVGQYEKLKADAMRDNPKMKVGLQLIFSWLRAWQMRLRLMGICRCGLKMASISTRVS